MASLLIQAQKKGQLILSLIKLVPFSLLFNLKDIYKGQK